MPKWAPCEKCPIWPNPNTCYHEQAGRCSFEDFKFRGAIVSNWIDGAQRPGRTVNGWKTIKWDRAVKFEYFKKLLGHAAQAFAATDAADAREHWAAVACNANILHYHEND